MNFASAENDEAENGNRKPEMLHETKGFGFIAPEGGGPDVFLHIIAVQRAGIAGLPGGQKVSYELETGRKGKSSAVDLKIH